MSTSSHADVSDVLILAAIDRAIRHRAREGGVPVWVILDHLSLPRRSRRAVAQLDTLEAAGSLARSRQHGRTVWVLTSTGRRRLQRARRAGTVPVLPESPQHREWREARALAEQQIEGFRKDLHDQAESALWLLDSPRLLGQPTPVESDAWFMLGELLQRACTRLASATYCLKEWAEPDDATADVDDASLSGERNGRRNIRHWSKSAEAH